MVTFIVTVVMFLVMISLHEFGHFIFGKLLGFTVLEYAIGFGPAIFKKQGKNTLYSVRLIPFGGFCKFAGEDGEDKAEKGNFNEQSPAKRFIVLVAGAVFNIILGFILFCFITGAGKNIYTNVISETVPGTYMSQQDILPGDRLVKVNGKKVSMYQDIQLYMSEIEPDKNIEITVERDGEKKNISFMPSLQHVTVTYNEDNIIYSEVLNGREEKTVIEYSEEVPKNDELIGKTEESTRYLIGFRPEIEAVNAFNIIPQSFRMTKYVVKLLYKTLWDLVTGRGSMDMVSGPVGVVKEVNNAVNAGSQSVLYVLNLVALLTINLGVFNLLPFPALDGGRILFVIIEWIRRKPVSPEKEGMVHTIGFLILIGLMIFISYRDILNLIVK